jgi:hypothetical protein
MSARTARFVGTIALAVTLVGALAWLRDPPWLLRVSSGFGSWQEDESGRRCRWTTRSHASFYVPSDAGQVTLPLRLGIARPDGGPVEASVAIDGRVFATVVLDDPLRWVPVTFTLPARPPAHRAVRIEIFVARLLRRQGLGIQVGEPAIRPRPGPRSGGTPPVTPPGEHRDGQDARR